MRSSQSRLLLAAGKGAWAGKNMAESFPRTGAWRRGGRVPKALIIFQGYLGRWALNNTWRTGTGARRETGRGGPGLPPPQTHPRAVHRPWPPPAAARLQRVTWSKWCALLGLRTVNLTPSLASASSRAPAASGDLEAAECNQRCAASGVEQAAVCSKLCAANKCLFTTDTQHTSPLQHPSIRVPGASCRQSV